MDPQIRSLFNDELLSSALARFGASKEQARILEGFENFIYEYGTPAGERILRISHSARHDADSIMGEVEWLNYLGAHGVPAAQVAPSLRGQWIEKLPVDGSYFCAVSFVKAPGHTASKEEWTPPLWRKLGGLVGRMNFLARSFQPSEERFRRADWQHELEGFAEKYLPPSEAPVIQKYNQALDYLKGLPQPPEAYGLIHQDVHRGNFLLEGEAVTLFDFDDIQYGWFAFDIAMALYYALPPDPGPKDVDYARAFLDAFVDGYCRENSLDARWLREIPHFLKMRELDLYVAIIRSFDLDHLDSWCARFMKGRRERISADAPFIEMDF